MKKRILAIALSLALILSAVPASALAQENDAAASLGTPGVDYVPGEAIVYVNGGAAALQNTNGFGRSAAPSYETEELMTVEDTAAVPEEASSLLRSAAADTGKSLVLVKSDQDTESLIADLQNNPNVTFAEPNYYVEPYGVGEPTDAGYAYQWALNNQMNSGDPTAAVNPAVDINAVEAWKQYDISSDKPVVAVLDSGVDYNHPDLKNIMWDDGLKYDTLTKMGGGQYGYNVLGGVNDEKPTDDPMDTDIGHGTHCAGIIGAQWNNDVQAKENSVAGVSPDVQIMAVRFLGNSGAGTSSSAIQGYAYIQAAAKAGVNVVAINNSWGPSNYDGAQLRSVSTAATAIGQEYGVVSCFAAGNSNVNNDNNTSGIVDSPYVVTVGAMDSQGYRSGFSCWGQESVDVFSPGSQILSTVTTYEDDANPFYTHTMPVQYLPQIQDVADSYFYENFESDAPKVGMRLLDAEGKEVETAKAATALGYNSAKSLALPLDSIENGQSFAIELTFDRKDIDKITTDKNFHIAFQGGCDNAMYGETFLIQYQNDEGQWTDINSTQIIGLDASGRYIYMPARLRLYDHSWVQSTQEVNLSDFGQYVNDSDKDTVTLRLVPKPAEGETKGVMSGKTGNTATFRLDDLGFGKKASNYFYSDGTSMATPVVTGLAALLSETFNSQTTKAEHAAEICARIKGGVNRTEQKDLADKSVSGGFIDAAATFNDSQCVPVLNDLEIDENGQATLSGYFFGTQGVLTVGSQAADVTSWANNTITFTLPAGVSGKQEIVVKPEGKDYGRDFFEVGLAARGYDSLSAPAISFGECEGYPLTSADLIPITMAATDTHLAYVGYQLESDRNCFSVYDIKADTWSKAALPENILPIPSEAYNSLAGGKTKFYLLYPELNAESTELTLKIGTYDPAAGSWTSVTAEGFSGTERLVVYKDQLLAVGGDDMVKDDTGATVSSNARATVKIVDPSTGKTTGSFADMPEGRSGATVTASGSTLMVTGGNSGAANASRTIYTNTLSYNGDKWVEYQDNLLSLEDLDAKQTLDRAYTAVNGGMLAVGPVSKLNQDGMRDTWSFKDGSWSADTSRLYSQSKTTRNIGAASGGQFYVLSYTGKTSAPLVFRATAVDYTGPTADPGSDKPVPPTPTPEPQPSVNPTPTAQPAGTDTTTTTTTSGKNAGTGIFETTAGKTLAMAAVLLIVAGGGFVLYRKRKNG